MKSFQDKVVVITGGASGIGLACGRAFLAEGAKVHLLDKDPSVEEQVAVERQVAGNEGRVTPHVVDVTDPQKMLEVSQRILSMEGRVDILHNNAGVCLSRAVPALSLDDWRWVLDINLWGVIHGIQAFLPSMVERRQGHIINTASLAGLVAFPMVVPYCASKFAVVGLSEAMAAELAPFGIGVTVECPGMVATNLFRNARVGWPEGIRRGFEWVMEKRGTSPDKVARNILRAVKRGDVVHVTAGQAYPLYLLKRVSWGLYGRLARWASGFRRPQEPVA